MSLHGIGMSEFDHELLYFVAAYVFVQIVAGLWNIMRRPKR